jgi:HAUS augmin-like complex subunit 1
VAQPDSDVFRNNELKIGSNPFQMADFSPSAIFSPSVARQQLATSKDWNYVDSWLSSKFNGKSPPPFERNNETLKALLALAAYNESADEEADLLAKTELKALHSIQSSQDSSNTEILTSIEKHLTPEGHTSLNVLSSLSVELEQALVDIEALGCKIIDFQVAIYDLEQTSDRVSILENHLSTELESINVLIKKMESDSYQPPAELSKQTMEYQRKARALAAKLPEIRNRAASVTTKGGVEVTIQHVKEEEESFKALKVAVRELETEARSFHGLPQDTDLARLQLESLRVELRELMQQRDSMFEGLVERESPKKSRR